MGYIRGAFRERIYRWLHARIPFDPWHITPVDKRDYGMGVIRHVNQRLKELPVRGKVIEIGCGLGDILADIAWPSTEKFGYDLSESCVRAARIVHPGLHFQKGSFEDVSGQDISCLIAVDFLHAIEPQKVKRYFQEIVSDNRIKMIVVDRVFSPPYRYSHDYEDLFRAFGYHCVFRSRAYVAWGGTPRYLMFFEA